MKGILIASLMALASTSSGVSAQVTDTLVDVGGYRLHFHIIRGHGVPILFESGGGDDATVWKGVLQPIAAVTGQRFDFSLLRDLTQRSEHDLLGQLKELIQNQMIVEESPDRFAFRHALTRQTVLINDSNRLSFFHHEKMILV